MNPPTHTRRSGGAEGDSGTLVRTLRALLTRLLERSSDAAAALEAALVPTLTPPLTPPPNPAHTPPVRPVPLVSEAPSSGGVGVGGGWDGWDGWREGGGGDTEGGGGESGMPAVSGGAVIRLLRGSKRLRSTGAPLLLTLLHRLLDGRELLAEASRAAGDAADPRHELQQLQQAQPLEQLQQLQRVQQLEQLEQLEQLQRVQQLQQLEQVQSLQVLIGEMIEVQLGVGEERSDDLWAELLGPGALAATDAANECPATRASPGELLASLLRRALRAALPEVCDGAHASEAVSEGDEQLLVLCLSLALAMLQGSATPHSPSPSAAANMRQEKRGQEWLPQLMPLLPLLRAALTHPREDVATLAARLSTAILTRSSAAPAADAPASALAGVEEGGVSHGGSPQGEYDEAATWRSALTSLGGSVPERAMGLAELRGLLLARSAHVGARLSQLVELCEIQLMHRDSYVYQSALNTLSAAAEVHPHRIFPHLAKLILPAPVSPRPPPPPSLRIPCLPALPLSPLYCT